VSEPLEPLTVKDVVRCTNDGVEIYGIWLGTTFVWPDPWVDIWDEGTTVLWENVWHNQWSEARSQA
jgi:hypothetical protein